MGNVCSRFAFHGEEVIVQDAWPQEGTTITKAEGVCGVSQGSIGVNSVTLKVFQRDKGGARQFFGDSLKMTRDNFQGK